MTITLITLLFCLVAALLLYRAARGQSIAVRQLEDVAGHTERVDLEAFRNLVDEQEHAYLRERLSAGKFRSLQRQRLAAAAEYIRRVAGNAAVLLRLGEASRQSENPAVAAAGRKLTGTAIQVRLLCLLALVRIYAQWVFPGSAASAGDVFRAYQQLKELTRMLASLQQPQLTGRVASML